VNLFKGWNPDAKLPISHSLLSEEMVCIVFVRLLVDAAEAVPAAVAD
jgi:hypothetical protein